MTRAELAYRKSTNRVGDAKTAELPLCLTLTGEECVDDGRWHRKIRRRDARPPNKSLVASASRAESEVASHFTPDDIMQLGAGCSGATILDDDGYPNCHELTWLTC